MSKSSCHIRQRLDSSERQATSPHNKIRREEEQMNHPLIYYTQVFSSSLMHYLRFLFKQYNGLLSLQTLTTPTACFMAFNSGLQHNYHLFKPQSKNKKITKKITKKNNQKSGEICQASSFEHQDTFNNYSPIYLASNYSLAYTPTQKDKLAAMEKHGFYHSTSFLPLAIIFPLIKIIKHQSKPFFPIPNIHKIQIKNKNRSKAIPPFADRNLVSTRICSHQQLPFLITYRLMNSETRKEIMDVLYVNEPTSRNFTQQFEYAHELITHQHQVEVSHGHQETPLEIRNYFTVQRQACLEKVTEILLENRIIKIIDTFQSANNPNPHYRKEEISNQSGLLLRRTQNIKKYTIFKSSDEQEDVHKIKDTKNVVKNIIRLFQCWLEENLPKYREVYEELETFIGKIKFNNHLIMKMVKDQTIREAFLLFGLKDGREFIDKSKIHDKKTHAEALQRYVDLFELESRCDHQTDKINATAEAAVMVQQQ